MKPIRLQKGIITEKLADSKEFYTRWLGMTLKFEADWFVLLALADAPEFELAFMLPGVQAVRKPYFQTAYSGGGVWLSPPPPPQAANTVAVQAPATAQRNEVWRRLMRQLSEAGDKTGNVVGLQRLDRPQIGAAPWIQAEGSFGECYGCECFQR